MAPRSEKAYSSDIAPLLMLAKFIEDASHQDGPILITAQLLEVVKRHQQKNFNHDPGAVGAIISAIEPASIRDRLNDISILLLCSVFVHSKACPEQFRGLFLLSDTLRANPADSTEAAASRLSNKVSLCRRALASLIKNLSHDGLPNKRRRWMGILALEMLDGCQTAAIEARPQISELATLYDVVNRERCQVLRLIASSLIQTLRSANNAHDGVSLDEYTRQLRSNFPNGQSEEAIWLTEFDSWFEQFGSNSHATRRGSEIFFAHAVCFEDMRYATEHKSAILVTFSEDLNIIITASTSYPAKYIDVPFENIQKVSVGQYSSTQSQSPSFAVIIALATAPNTCYVNAAGSGCPSIALTFFVEDVAKAVQQVLLSHTIGLVDVMQPTEAIDVSSASVDFKQLASGHLKGGGLKRPAVRTCSNVPKRRRASNGEATYTRSHGSSTSFEGEEDSRWTHGPVSQAVEGIDVSQRDHTLPNIVTEKHSSNRDHGLVNAILTVTVAEPEDPRSTKRSLTQKHDDVADLSDASPQLSGSKHSEATRNSAGGKSNLRPLATKLSRRLDNDNEKIEAAYGQSTDALKAATGQAKDNSSANLKSRSTKSKERRREPAKLIKKSLAAKSKPKPRLAIRSNEPIWDIEQEPSDDEQAPEINKIGVTKQRPAQPKKAENPKRATMKSRKVDHALPKATKNARIDANASNRSKPKRAAASKANKKIHGHYGEDGDLDKDDEEFEQPKPKTKPKNSVVHAKSKLNSASLPALKTSLPATGDDEDEWRQSASRNEAEVGKESLDRYFNGSRPKDLRSDPEESDEIDLVHSVQSQKALQRDRPATIPDSLSRNVEEHTQRTRPEVAGRSHVTGRQEGAKHSEPTFVPDSASELPHTTSIWGNDEGDVPRTAYNMDFASLKTAGDTEDSYFRDAFPFPDEASLLKNAIQNTEAAPTQFNEGQAPIAAMEATTGDVDEKAISPKSNLASSVTAEKAPRAATSKGPDPVAAKLGHIAVEMQKGKEEHPRVSMSPNKVVQNLKASAKWDFSKSSEAQASKVPRETQRKQKAFTTSQEPLNETKSRQERTPAPPKPQKAPIISFSTSGPRNQGTRNSKKPESQQLPRSIRKHDLDSITNHSRLAINNRVVPYVDDPAPWEHDRMAGRSKQTLILHSDVREPFPEKLPVHAPELIEKLHRASSQVTRVTEQGSPIGLSQPHAHGLEACKSGTNNELVKQTFAQANIDDQSDLEAFSVDVSGCDDPTIALGPPLPNVKELPSRNAINNSKQLPSSPGAPSAIDVLPAEHLYRDGTVIDTSKSKITMPRGVQDPFIGASQNPSGLFLAALHRANDIKVGVQIRQENAKAMTGLKRSMFQGYDEDLDKTLVEPLPIVKKRKILHPVSSNPSQNSPGASSVRRSQAETHNETYWSKAFEPQYMNVAHTLSRMTHLLVRNLVDKETAIKDMINDYAVSGIALIKTLGEEQQKQAESDYMRADQVRHKVARVLQKAHVDLKTISRDTGRTMVKDLEASWETQRVSMMTAREAALAACVEV